MILQLKSLRIDDFQNGSEWTKEFSSSTWAEQYFGIWVGRRTEVGPTHFRFSDQIGVFIGAKAQKQYYSSRV